MTRAWWTLPGMGCLGTPGMALHGGAAMIYVMWIVFRTALTIIPTGRTGGAVARGLFAILPA